MHTSPLLQPGSGDAGGLNVYIHELAQHIAKRGIEVHVFTRRVNDTDPATMRVGNRYVVHNVVAGPAAPLPVADQPQFVNEFAHNTIEILHREGPFDIVHSHYWLSGWAGALVKEALGIPMANSFHTLGKVKDLSLRADESPASVMRNLTEFEVIQRSNCVIASTPFEQDDLLTHYGASPEQICTSPPGIDHAIFRPGDQNAARTALGLGDTEMILFVGRIQALKGLDVAIFALEAMESPADLTIIGGPSGQGGDQEIEGLKALAVDLHVEHRVRFLEPLPHADLARYYQAADVLVMPSRSEAFGLVAAEAQACGLPVVASRIGGLPHVVADKESGILVEVGDVLGFAAALDAILRDSALRETLGRGAIHKAVSFSWSNTADRLLELYAGISADDSH